MHAKLRPTNKITIELQIRQTEHRIPTLLIKLPINLMKRPSLDDWRGLFH